MCMNIYACVVVSKHARTKTILVIKESERRRIRRMKVMMIHEDRKNKVVCNMINHITTPRLWTHEISGVIKHTHNENLVIKESEKVELKERLK